MMSKSFYRKQPPRSSEVSVAPHTAASRASATSVIRVQPDSVTSASTRHVVVMATTPASETRKQRASPILFSREQPCESVSSPVSLTLLHSARLISTSCGPVAESRAGIEGRAGV